MFVKRSARTRTVRNRYQRTRITISHTVYSVLHGHVMLAEIRTDEIHI